MMPTKSCFLQFSIDFIFILLLVSIHMVMKSGFGILRSINSIKIWFIWRNCSERLAFSSLKSCDHVNRRQGNELRS